MVVEITWYIVMNGIRYLVDEVNDFIYIGYCIRVVVFVTTFLQYSR